MQNVKAVILAGGSGERFWPLSTPENPKQFLKVFGNESLIRQTAARLKGLLAPEDIYVVTGTALAKLTRRELPELPRRNVIGEPMRRDTAAAVALGVGVAAEKGDPILAFLPADQLVTKTPSFQKAFREAVRRAKAESEIVTLGVRPTRPATTFGYIDPKKGSFVEKPDAVHAKAYVRRGFLWNAGMFIARASVFRAAFAAAAPQLAPLFGTDARRLAASSARLKAVYETLPRISFDYAIMEKQAHVSVVPVACGWDDVGGYAAFDKHFKRDEKGCVKLGDVTAVESEDCTLVANGPRVATLGVKGLVVVSTQKGVLVCAKEKASELKKLFLTGVLALLAFAQTLTTAADTFTFDVRTDRADQLYVPGETAEFNVTCRGADGHPATSGVVVARLDNFGSRNVSERRFDLAKSAAFLVSGTLAAPGFLRLTLTAEKPDAGQRVWSVGFAPHEIKAGGKCPDDFDAFWKTAREKLSREIPLDPQVKRNPARSTETFDFYNISFATFGRRVYGFMSIPKGASPANRYPVNFSVSAAGFGDWSQNMYGSADEIRVFLTAYDWEPRGNTWQADKPKYAALNAEARAKWGVSSYSTSGISAGREHSFFYPLILGADRVIDWVAARPEVDVNRFRYSGTSQGGMMGFILTGLNRHILRSVLFVPAGCDHLAHKQARQCGWPNFVEQQPDREKKAVVEKWAPYFDAANFAKNITCPLHVVFGFSDTTCCPPSVWAAYNASPSQQKSIEGGIGMGHGVYGELWRKGDAWLRENNARELTAATPESQGVPSAAILRWLEVCEKSLDALHGFVLVRHGKTIAEGWWKPQSADQLHELYSHSKSFTSSAVGLLVDDNKLDLDECVADILPDKLPTNASARLRAVRVRDLLTMNYGCDKDHQLREPGDWAAQALAKPLARDGGRGYRYDSDATHLLACVVERKTGMKLMDFLRRRMFDFVGIRPDVWSSVSPTGVACGGWGMSMTTRDLARFGQLYLQEGRWGDRQILSSDWVRLASACQTRSGWNGKTAFGDCDWHRGYGFQFWRCRHGAFRADGAAGQLTIVMPKEDAVLSVTASLSSNMQDEINTLWYVLLPAMKDAPLPEEPAMQSKLKAKLASLKLKTVVGEKTDVIGAKALGKTWKLDQTEKGFHFKDVSLAEKGTGWELVLTGDFGKQTVPVGYGDWNAGRVKLYDCNYGKISTILGEQDAFSAGAWIRPGVFQVKTQFVATIFTGLWTLDFTSPDCVKFSYRAAGHVVEATGKSK